MPDKCISSLAYKLSYEEFEKLKKRHPLVFEGSLDPNLHEFNAPSVSTINFNNQNLNQVLD